MQYKTEVIQSNQITSLQTIKKSAQISLDLPLMNQMMNISATDPAISLAKRPIPHDLRSSATLPAPNSILRSANRVTNEVCSAKVVGGVDDGVRLDGQAAAVEIEA